MSEPTTSLTGRDILLVSSDDYDAGLTTSKHQLTRLLCRENRVLFIESVGLRRPVASGHDLRRIGRKIRRYWAGPVEREARLWVLTPLAVPLHDQLWARVANNVLVARQIRRAARRLGFRDPLLWMFLPSLAGIAGRCGETLLVYYNVDDFAEFSGSNAAVINELDQALTRRADVVFASSLSLADRKRQLNPYTSYSPHGVDVEHFAAALDSPPPPPDIADLRGPVIGYWGWIADYFDLDAVDGIAAARPAWNVLLIGDSRIDLSRLARRPNVRRLGSRPYADLPAYAAHCDVLLIPRELNPLTRAMNPLKLREYLATGRPVVSSPLPEVIAARERKYGDAVSIAATPEEFVTAIEAQLAAAAPDRPRRIAALVADESWSARLAAVSAEILAAEQRRRDRRTKAGHLFGR